MPSLKEMLFGSAPKIKEQPRFTPEQQQILSQLLSQIQGGLPEGFDYLTSILSDDPEMFRQFEAPTLRAFEEETIPSILERFSGLGARSSSGLNQTLARAGESLQEKLGAQRANLKGGAAQSLFNLLGTGLNQTTTPYIKGGMTGLIPYLGQGLQGAFTNPLSKYIESSLDRLLGNSSIGGY